MINELVEKKSFIPKLLVAAAAVIFSYSSSFGQLRTYTLKDNVTQEPLTNTRVILGEDLQDTIYTNNEGKFCWPIYRYKPGDFNMSSQVNIADVISMFSWFKTGNPQPSYEAECPPNSGNFWSVSGDVNGNCTNNIADVIHLFSKLRTGDPEITYCSECPPAIW